MDAAERIVDAVRRSAVPVHAWVHPRAFSAGAFIALSTKQIHIEPGGVIGAATPVSGEGSKLPEKYVSAMRAEFRALAEERGLDPRIAEAMVDETVGVPGVLEPGRLLTSAWPLRNRPASRASWSASGSAGRGWSPRN